MRIYDIYDEENGMSVGTLLYYDKENTFLIELPEYLDEWSAPLLFTNLVKRNIFSISRQLSLTWVKERIIPSGRQNIGSILSTHKLKSYDEMKFLELSDGRCSQDSYCIRKIDELPIYVEERMKHNLVDCLPLDGYSILCFFADDSTKKVSLSQLKDIAGVDKILKNDALFASCSLGTGGFYITFDDAYDIPAWALYQKGRSIPLKYQDFTSFARYNILDTTDSCNILECSRQNLSYIASKNQLEPIKKNANGNLYLKRDILKSKW